MRAAVALLGLSACTAEVVTEQQTVISAIVDDVILRNTEAFATATAELSTAVDALCDAPDATRLQAARDAWWAARAPQKHHEVIAFGPTREEPWRVGPKLDTWPARADSIDTWLESDSGLTQSDFDAMGTVTRGMPVLEYLLWTPDTLTWIDSGTRPCEALVGSAADIAKLATTQHAAWSPDGDNWRAYLVDPANTDGPYATHQDVIDELVNRMGFTLENTRHIKLGEPSGLIDGGDTQPELLESRPSARSLQDAKDALAGVNDLLHGDGGQGLSTLLAGHEAAITKFDEAYAASVTAMGTLPDPLEPALTTARADIEAARQAIRDIQVAVQVDIAQALSVSIAFNDNDGD